MNSGFFEKYWEFQRNAVLEYGENAVVLIRKGSFYEAYQYKQQGIAHKVAKVLNMLATMSNKNKTLSDNNPVMVGFPFHASEKNIPVLVANDITVVLVEQVWDNKRIVDRRQTRVFTPGTYVECVQTDDAHYICALQALTSALFEVAVMDATIGSVELLTLTSVEDLHWFLAVYNPKETLLIGPMELKATIAPEGSGRIVYDKKYLDKTLQRSIVDDVYPDALALSAADIPEASLSPLACLLQFVSVCHHSALRNIEYPKTDMFKANRLSLHNNAVTQLNLLASNNGNGLFGALNRTCTAMGRRALKTELLNPMTVSVEIERKYDEVDSLLKNEKRLSQLTETLSQLPDLERLFKRMETGCATTMAHVCTIHDGVRVMCQALKINGEESDLHAVLDAVLDTSKQEFKNNKEFEAKTTRLNELKELLQKTTEKYNTKIEHNDTLGFYIATTPKRAENIKKNYPGVQINKINSTTVSVFTENVKKLCDLLTEQLRVLEELVSDLLRSWIHTLVETHGREIRALCAQVATLDCVMSKANCVNLYKLARPRIDSDSTDAFLTADKLRHPLIKDYVPNDCALDTRTAGGMLLYGLNGSGKSCLSKAIALNVILAQAGFYVFAESFRFSPFTKIFTRINCDDDLYNGLSSFAVEMSELRSILRLADKDSLVIGDELCKGTETESAVSLVAASIRWLSDHGVKFVFATHLHKLTSIDCVKDLAIQVRHITSEYRDGKLVFIRDLAHGQGDTRYGIEVASQILGFPEVTNNAMMIRNELNGGTKTLKKSRYNSKVVMKQCHVCKTKQNLHTHHIEHQASFDQSQKNQRKKMNDTNNLVVLCAECHDKVHSDKIRITKIYTLSGIQAEATSVLG